MKRLGLGTRIGRWWKKVTSDSPFARQWEAAEVLGFDRLSAFRYVILPEVLSFLGFRSRRKDRKYDLYYKGGMPLGRVKLKSFYDPEKREGEELIRFEHVSKRFEGDPLYRDIGLTVHRGEVISVIGPLGSGRKTILRLMSGLERPTEGRVIAMGEELDDRRAELSELRMKVGMIPYGAELFPHLSVIRNVMLAPVCLKKMDVQEAFDKGMELLAGLGLADRAHAFPGELSKGEAIRVVMVRALAMEPEMLLLDLPTTGLKFHPERECIAAIRMLAERGMTMVIVADEERLIEEASDRVILLSGGGILDIGTPEEILHGSRSELAQTIIRRIHYQEFTIESPSFDFLDKAEILHLFSLVNRLPKSTEESMLTCFDSLCEMGLVPAEGSGKELRVSTEYHAGDDRLDMTLTWNGSMSGILSDRRFQENDLTSLFEDVDFSWDGKTNRLVLKGIH